MQKVSDLLTLLEDERRMILSGDLRSLPTLTDAKVNALSQLGQSDATQQQISQLQSIAARNQNLLTAAANGIRSAQQRLDAIRNRDQGVKTYTQTGASQILSRVSSSFEKRA
jgi:division protein CdvB (Snf7/Vps24/ESCRT-III family)